MKGNSRLHLKFSDIVFYLGSFFALLMGVEATRRQEFLRIISSRLSGYKVFFYTLSSNFLILAAGFLFIFGCSFLVVLLNNIKFTTIDMKVLLGFLISSLLLLLFFLLMGMIIGNSHFSKAWKPSLMVVWISFLFIIPEIFNTVIEYKSETLSSTYKLYNDKLKIVNNFENRIEKKYGKFDANNIEIERKIVEDYWNVERKQLVELENRFKREQEKLIDTSNTFSLLTPTTFYNSTCFEAGGKGYVNYISFYDYLTDMYRQFLRFWIDRVYYNDPKVMVSFIKADENIFRSRSALPHHFGTGIAVSLGWVVLLVFASYLLYIRNMTRLNEKDFIRLRESEIELMVDTGTRRIILVEDHMFKDFLYNVFSGNTAGLVGKKFTGEVILDDTEITTSTEKQDFLYLCRPQDLPGDITVKDFITFFASLQKTPAAQKESVLDRPEIKPIKNRCVAELKNHEVFEMLLALTYFKEHEIYLIYEIATDLPFACSCRLLDRMEELKESGALVLYLTTTDLCINYKANPGRCYDDGEGWTYFVEGRRKSAEMENRRKNGN